MLVEPYAIVDRNDTFIYGLYCTKASLHESNILHRGVHVFIETFGGGFVLQKKANGSENEGKWSSAVSGHVRSGEHYIDAAIRETKEEVGISVDDDDLNFVLKLNASRDTGNEFVMLYSLLIDPSYETLYPNPEELDELLTMPRAMVEEDVVKNNEIYSAVFRILFAKFIK